MNQMDDLRKLKHGWDSYGAEPPSQAACDNAERFLAGCQPIPTTRGGIAFEWSMCGWELYIEFLKNDTCTVDYSSPSDDVEVK